MTSTSWPSTGLLQQRFRNRSLNNPDQPRIDFGDSDEAADAAAGLGEAVEEISVAELKRRKRSPKSHDKLPAQVPRREVVARVPDSVRHYGQHGARTLLPESMWDVTETLVFARPQLSVSGRPDRSGARSPSGWWKSNCEPRT